MSRRLVSGVLLLLVISASCASDNGDDSAESATTTSSMAPLVSATAPGSAPLTTATTAATTELIEFCRLALAAGGELPESFIGSPEHVEMVDSLATAAPAEIRPQLETYRDFLASGAIDPADPESNTVDNWPAEVRAATADAQQFISDSC